MYKSRVTRVGQGSGVGSRESEPVQLATKLRLYSIRDLGRKPRSTALRIGPMLHLLLLAAILPFQNDSTAGLELVRLDSGVYAALRKDPLSLAVNSNSLIIVRDSDV